LLRLITLTLCVSWCVAGPAAAAGPERVERGALVTEGIPELPTALVERLRRYQNTRPAAFVSWLPGDHGLLVSTRFGETRQIHRVAAPGGAREQLTFFQEPVFWAAASPDPAVNGFLYERDVGGSEFYQIYFFDLATGQSTLLTDGKSRNGNVVWANDGGRFAYHSSRRNGSDVDLWIGDVREPGEGRMVLAEGGVWYVQDWSPDDRRLIVERNVSRTESHLFVLELDGGRLTPLLPEDRTVAVGLAQFAVDGRGVYYTSDEDGEFIGLRYRDLADGSSRSLTSDIPWDVEAFAVSDDGAVIAFVVNDNGVSRVWTLDLASGERRALDGLPPGVASEPRFEPGGRRLALSLNTSASPGDVYSIDVDDGTVERWTKSELGGLDADRLVDPELVRYPTFDEAGGDRRLVPAFLYRPREAGPHPVVIHIHGGPEAQARPVFSPIVQFLVEELGVAVLRPNVRGSTGYGKTYVTLDDGFRREDAVRDIGALLDWIEVQDELDAGRVAVLGASYGGYMALASLVHYGDRLRCGVDAVGIGNFVTFLENTESYRRDLRRVEYGDERDSAMRAFLEDISPANQADRIRRPLFVAQGLNDPRVPASESERMVEVVREHGGEVWYLLALNEGHGFARKSNRDFYSAAMMLFLDRYLLGPGDAVATAVAGDATAGANEAEVPEAVVLLHGLGRTRRAMAPLTERLREAGFDAHNLAYPSRDAPPEELVENIAEQIEACCANAPRLHFVGHSLGGILARAYVAQWQPPNLGRMVMLSPPNQGSEIIDSLGDSWLFEAVMGPSAVTLGTDEDSFPNSLPPPDYELGIVAATESINPVGSAIIPGDDDGMVAVCRMRLEGMTDFITVDHTHALIMRSEDVARQVVRFLREGRFDHAGDSAPFDPAECESAASRSGSQE
jgi:dipeptidyl aminopeptidase/acylaminoacyl peptidase